jgi:hypothetical protein
MKRSTRLNRAVTAVAVVSDDMMIMLIVLHYNRQNGHTLEDCHQQKKNMMFLLPTAIFNQNPKLPYAVK